MIRCHGIRSLFDITADAFGLDYNVEKRSIASHDQFRAWPVRTVCNLRSSLCLPTVSFTTFALGPLVHEIQVLESCTPGRVLASDCTRYLLCSEKTRHHIMIACDELVSAGLMMKSDTEGPGPNGKLKGYAFGKVPLIHSPMIHSPT